MFIIPLFNCGNNNLFFLQRHKYADNEPVEKYRCYLVEILRNKLRVNCVLNISF